jgi:hypothetical protein
MPLQKRKILKLNLNEMLVIGAEDFGAAFTPRSDSKKIINGRRQWQRGRKEKQQSLDY